MKTIKIQSKRTEFTKNDKKFTEITKKLQDIYRNDKKITEIAEKSIKI